MLSADEAPLLKMQPGEPVLTMERTAYDAANEVIEFGTHIYNAELYSFRFTLHDSQSN